MTVRAFSLVLLLTLGLGACVQAAPAAPERPKLVVAILVDQLRFDYLERFHDQFCPGGFRMLLDGGTFMTYAHYDYIPTITAPGHASVFSGAPPAAHGIIGNDWFDKRTKKMVYCVGDPNVKGVGTEAKEGMMSPRNFIGSNFADEMRLRFQSKVIGISLKDRGAVLPAGKMPAGAYWWEPLTGNFVTSTYYRPQLPDWVQQFNDRHRPQQFVGNQWDRLIDPKLYEREDILPGEGSLTGEKTPTFPHTIYPYKPAEPKKTATSATVAETADPSLIVDPKVLNSYENIRPTPYGNQLLLEFAAAALEGEKLGQGTQPDFFVISFSSVDAAGHKFGPYSQEVQDIVLRLDLQLAELFKMLEKQVGLDKVAIMLTADHGVSPAPEFSTTQGFDGQRFDSVLSMGDLVLKLGERFGTAKVLLTQRLVDGNLFFDYDVMRQAKVSSEELTTFIREWALSSGFFQAAYGREQILGGRVTGPIGERLVNGFNAERSGDMVLVFKPYTLGWSGKTGTTHGSPYAYDTHVPVLFYGAPFVRGRFADDFHITDIVPTLCAALHVNEPPGCIGKPLVKLLVEEPGSVTPPAATVPLQAGPASAAEEPGAAEASAKEEEMAAKKPKPKPVRSK